MNKKRLSVVMAGAMLASSVAPVLAAEVVKEDKTANELGLLMEELRTLVDSKVYSNVKENYPNGKPNLKNKSVYVIYINGKEQEQLVAGASQDVWQGVFNEVDAGDKIEVYSDGFNEVDGKILGYEIKTETKKYTKVDELKKLADDFYYVENTNKEIAAKYSSLVKSANYDERTGKVTITFTKDTGMVGDTNNSIVVGLNDNMLDVDKFIDASGDEKEFRKKVSGQDPAGGYVTPGEFYGFAEVGSSTDAVDIKSELVREITITPGGYDLKLEDLYDGLMLTTKGHDFFEMLKEAKAMGRKVNIVGNNYKFGEDKPWILKADTKGGYAVSDCIKSMDGKSRFSVTFEAMPSKKLSAETYTITGLNEANTERFVSWMITNPNSSSNGNKELSPLARVDILAGSNRYETAVEIAKEYAGLVGPSVDNTNRSVKNIVLVNGESLVDGLAAAPLAAKKVNTVHNKQVSAPILLTEADHLPKATKVYLKELMANFLVGDERLATIHLVGGESVLNKSLERELKSLGFKVERYGGDNREETSLEVAKAVGLADGAFVVGGEGEADAMSVAAVAADTQTPIVVAKKGGITEDAIYELKDKNVTVIGGETVVSKADENAIKAEANAVIRISGANRQATNAEIIRKYYKGNFLRAENVIVAKDGRANKTELVDALAAANMASHKNAPIVLATDKLSKDQLDALILNAKDAEALYQVGIGVDKENVVRVIARQLGLTNR